MNYQRDKKIWTVIEADELAERQKMMVIEADKGKRKKGHKERHRQGVYIDSRVDRCGSEAESERHTEKVKEKQEQIKDPHAKVSMQA